MNGSIRRAVICTSESFMIAKSITIITMSSESACARTLEIKASGARWFPFVAMKPLHTRPMMTSTAAPNAIPKVLLTLAQAADKPQHLFHRRMRMLHAFRGIAMRFKPELVLVVILLQRLQHGFPIHLVLTVQHILSLELDVENPVLRYERIAVRERRLRFTFHHLRVTRIPIQPDPLRRQHRHDVARFSGVANILRVLVLD